jgi:RNA polymerase sigma-70 factor (ECF subfamily)
MNQDAGESWDWPLIRKRCKAEALRVVRRHHDAEEVVQEALARAWRSRGSCRTPEAPMPWCLQITRNEALRLLGRRGTLGSGETLELEDEFEDHRAHGEVDRAMLRVDLDRALQTLTPHERLLIGLRYEYDCSHPEIAARLRIPEATARVHLHRARKRLKPLL